MTGLEIAALIAAIGGAAMQYKATTDAQERQRRVIQENLARQEEFQRKAEQTALDNAAKYKNDDRVKEQSQIAAEVEQSLITPVSESQAIREQQQTTQGDVSDDYTVAKAKSDAKVMQDAADFARIIGKTTSAQRLRMNEGIRLMDTGQRIDQLGGFSRGSAQAAQYDAQLAGMPNAGLTFGGQVLGALGTAGMMAGGSAGKTAAEAGGSGLSATGGQTGLSLTGGSTGLTVPQGGGISLNGNNAWVRAFPGAF